MIPRLIFHCALCGRKFAGARSDADTLAEYRALFGPSDRGPLALHCDDCFQKVRPDRHQAFAQKLHNPQSAIPNPQWK